MYVLLCLALRLLSRSVSILFNVCMCRLCVDARLVVCIGRLNVVADLGLLISMFYTYYGARATSIVGGVLSAGGYALLALLVPHNLPLGVYGVCFFCIGQGNFGVFSVCLQSVSKNEAAKNRGKVTGLLQASYGMCALVFSNVFEHVVDGDVVPFFWVMSIVSGSAALLTLLLVDAFPTPEGVAPSLAPPTLTSVSQPYALLPEASAASGADHAHPEAQSDESVGFLLRSIDFWLLWWAFCFLAGAGLMWKNLVGNVVAAMSGAGQLPLDGETPTQFASHAVQLWSISTACGRIASGIASDALTKHVRRPVWIIVAAVLMLGAMSSLAIFTILPSSHRDLTVFFWLADIINATAYGCAFAMCSTVMSLLFGTQRCATHHFHWL